MIRPWLNHWRRRVARALLYRMVFGESRRPHTRIAPSTCIDGEAGLQLADHVFIGQFNFIDASAGLVIEEGVQITNFCSIVTHSTHNALRINGRRFAVKILTSTEPVLRDRFLREGPTFRIEEEDPPGTSQYQYPSDPAG